MAQMQAEGNQAILAALTRPKETIITDANGEVIRKGVVH
jgi:hypothetical protein